MGMITKTTFSSVFRRRQHRSDDQSGSAFVHVLVAISMFSATFYLGFDSILTSQKALAKSSEILGARLVLQSGNDYLANALKNEWCLNNQLLHYTNCNSDFNWKYGIKNTTSFYPYDENAGWTTAGTSNWTYQQRANHSSYCIDEYMNIMGRGVYIGTSGALTGSVSYAFSKDKKPLEIHGAFPGENGFCGGYFSPLVFMFDESTPKFEAQVFFPLNASGITHWPETGTNVGFLVYDKDANGKVQFDSELFGDNTKGDQKYENGFEKLKTFDSNKDGKINKKDKLFSKLAIWKDSNASGSMETGELIPLKTLVIEISLKYVYKGVTPIGDRAELREISTFTPADAKKKLRIIDVYFAPGDMRGLASVTENLVPKNNREGK